MLAAYIFVINISCLLERFNKLTKFLKKAKPIPSILTRVNVGTATINDPILPACHEFVWVLW